MKKVFILFLMAILPISMFGFRKSNADAPNIVELGGKNRYETSAKVALEFAKDSETVIIASGENFPDALSGGQLALAYNAPILLTEKKELPGVIVKAINTIRPKNAIIVGGENAVSRNVEQHLKSGLQVTRIAGENRFETSYKAYNLAYEKTGWNKTVVVSGYKYPDALAACGYMAATKSLMILSDGNSFPELDGEVVLIGGKNTLPMKNMNFNGTRIYGSNRFETSINVSKEASKKGTKVSTVVCVNGNSFPDALSAATVCSSMGSNVLLTDGKDINDRHRKILNDKVGIVIGGENSMSYKIRQQIREIAFRFKLDVNQTVEEQPSEAQTVEEQPSEAQTVEEQPSEAQSAGEQTSGNQRYVDNKKVYLGRDIKSINSSASDECTKENKYVIKMGGNTYNRGINFYLGSGSITYNLNGKYRSLKGKIGFIDDSTNDYKRDVRFILDGQLVGVMSFDKGKIEYEFEIPVENANKLDIIASGGSGRIGIVDAYLSNENVYSFADLEYFPYKSGKYLLRDYKPFSYNKKGNKFILSSGDKYIPVNGKKYNIGLILSRVRTFLELSSVDSESIKFEVNAKNKMFTGKLGFLEELNSSKDCMMKVYSDGELIYTVKATLNDGIEDFRIPLENCNVLELKFSDADNESIASSYITLVDPKIE